MSDKMSIADVFIPIAMLLLNAEKDLFLPSVYIPGLQMTGDTLGYHTHMCISIHTHPGMQEDRQAKA